jgi:hypothetical protein
MEASEKVEQLIGTKAWNDLTVDEKAMVIDVLGSRDQYNTLRDVHFALLASEKVSIKPNANILNNLHGRFREKNSPARSSSVFSYRMPAFAALVLVVIAAFAGWIGAKYTVDPVTMTDVVTKHDTVFVASRPDTVLLTAVRYKTIIKEVPVNVSLSQNTTQAESSGMNMKETEALQTLLVSGSE